MSDEGIAFRVRHVSGPPVVSIRVWLRGGQRSERRPGLAWACGRMLTEGTRSRDWQAVALDAESRGASIQGFSGAEVHGLACDGLSGDWQQLLEWTRELLIEPTFPSDRLAWVVRQGQGELAALHDPPDSATYLAFLDQIYAPQPRSRPPQGNATDLVRLTPSDVEGFHGAGLGRGALISVAGRIDEEAVGKRIQKLFGDLPRQDREVLPPADLSIGPSELRREVAVGGQGQAHLFLGHRTVPRWHSDESALAVGGVVLGAGAGLTGRIPQRVREVEGLAYTATAATIQDAGTDLGRTTFYVGTSAETVAAAERAVREEIARVLADGLTEEEFLEARGYLLSREPFRRETARQWVSRMAESLFWKRPCDEAEWCAERWRGVNYEDVCSALRRHLHPERFNVTIGR